MMSSKHRMGGVFCGVGDNNAAAYYMLGWMHSSNVEKVPLKKDVISGQTILFFGY